MLTVIRNALHDPALRSPQLTALHRRLARVYDSRYTLGLLLALGIARVVVFLLAYPPAHGADSLDYYLHAAFLSGLDLPVNVASTSPLYPVVVAISYYGFGSFALILALQLAMSAVEGTLYYLALRSYSPAVAFAAALVITADPQIGVLYNFTSTEPLYLFLLAGAFSLLLVQSRKRTPARLHQGDVLLGMALFALTVTRTVGRYLFIPLGILFLLGTRDWRRALALALGFFVTSLVFNTLYNARINALADAASRTSANRVVNVNDSMMLRPLFQRDLIRADSGPSSAELVGYRVACSGQTLTCVVEKAGGPGPFQRLINSAYVEMIRARPLDYARIVLDEFTRFLVISGQQYHGEPTPAEVQCGELDEHVRRNVTLYAEKDWAVALAANLNRDVLASVFRDFAQKTCPPGPHHAGILAVVDQVAFRYRSLSRPNPYLWYGALVALVVLIHWARRFWLPVLAAGAILVNHAAISALVANVQPRYVAVTNPSKAILLVILAYIVGVLVVRIVDEWFAQRDRKALRLLTPLE